MVEVKVYSTPTCPWCHKAKEFLTEHKIKFEDLNVAEDAEARDTMIEKSGQMGVPVITVDDEVILGYDEPKLKELLKL